MKRLIPVVLAVVFFAFQAESNETWRGLVVAPEDRCSDYASDDYSYPQSVEPEIVEAMGGRTYGPYTGTCFSSIRETDIEHIRPRERAVGLRIDRHGFHRMRRRPGGGATSLSGKSGRDRLPIVQG